MTGAPTFKAISVILQILAACRSDSDPPKTVKSWLKTNTSRPLIVPDPVTTPSPGIFWSCIPVYGVPGMFVDRDGSGTHGLNERVRVRSLYDSRDYLFDLVRAYAG